MNVALVSLDARTGMYVVMEPIWGQKSVPLHLKMKIVANPFLSPVLEVVLQLGISTSGHITFIADRFGLQFSSFVAFATPVLALWMKFLTPSFTHLWASAPFLSLFLYTILVKPATRRLVLLAPLTFPGL